MASGTGAKKTGKSAGRGGKAGAEGSMQVLRDDLKNGTLKPVYLLFGDEEYLKTFYKKQFRETICGDDTMNYNAFDGKPDMDELISQLDTMPFFGDRRLVLASDTGLFKAGKKPKADDAGGEQTENAENAAGENGAVNSESGTERGSSDKGSGAKGKSAGGGGAADQLTDYIPRIPETSCLLIVESDVDKRSRLYKQIKKCGYVCELNAQDEAMLSRWAVQYLTRAGKKIRTSTMAMLLQKTGASMDNILSELEKLISYTGAREVIEDADVETICTVKAEDRVFDMIAEASLGNRSRAMKYYEDLLELREPPMKILALIGRSYNQILQTKELMQSGKSAYEIRTALGLWESAVNKLMNQARRYTAEELRACIRTCETYDEAIKLGNLSDRLAVELLLTA